MMRSLYSGVAGLKNHQTRMDVVGNNIANVNTTGFKYGRTTFNDMLSQNVKGASSAANGRGGTNPLQIGLGMSVASVDNIFTTGSMQSTGKPTDLAIDGDGMFILQSGMERYYTRAGNFDFDEMGNYVVPNTGLQVMGWLADAQGNIINAGDAGSLAYLTVPLTTPMAPRASTSINLSGNLQSDAAIGTERTAPQPIYDSLGQKHNMITTFEKTGVDVWSYTIEIDGYTPATYTGSISFAPDGTILELDGDDVTTRPPVHTGIVVDEAGNITSISTDPTDPYVFTAAPANGAAPLNISINVFNKNVTAITQNGEESTANGFATDGYPPGMLDKSSITVDGRGVITGTFSNGRLQALGQVAMSTFTNPGGLTKIGTSLYMQSNNSGLPQINQAGTNGMGEISPSRLEMSNVDLSEEFTSMITTQRGFQANSRIITTSDSMLEELVNLKR